MAAMASTMGDVESLLGVDSSAPQTWKMVQRFAEDSSPSSPSKRRPSKRLYVSLVFGNVTFRIRNGGPIDYFLYIYI